MPKGNTKVLWTLPGKVAHPLTGHATRQRIAVAE
jgi:hypothetical protein